MALPPDARHAGWLRRQDRAPMLGVSADFIRVKDVLLFLAVTFTLSWGAWIGLRWVFPPLAIRTFLAMFGPTFGAIVVIRRRQREHVRHHARLGSRRIGSRTVASLLAGLLVAIVVATGFWFSLLTGDLKLPGSSGQDLFQTMPFPAAVFVYWITAFGEEYGWRGFLVPALAPLGGARCSVLVALIFALWHAPAILFDGFNFPHHHILGIFDMLVFALPFSVVQSWLRSSTSSVAAPATAHGVFNMLTGVLYASTYRTTSIIAAPIGLLGTLPFAIVALLIVVTGRLWAPTKLTSP